MSKVSSVLVSVIVWAAAGCAARTTPPGSAGGDAATTCPEAVTRSIGQKFPGASMTGCKAEHEDGRDQFEVKLAGTGGARTEVDVAPDGTVLQTEEAIALDQVPAPVRAAFAARYPGASARRAERQARPGRGTTYELAFTVDGKGREATFAEDGGFVGEE